MRTVKSKNNKMNGGLEWRLVGRLALRGKGLGRLVAMAVEFRNICCNVLLQIIPGLAGFENREIDCSMNHWLRCPAFQYESIMPAMRRGTESRAREGSRCVSGRARAEPRLSYRRESRSNGSRRLEAR
ncbi:hypothetical protein [Burkholderia plantarii]|uniref:hypothetical protein n=1 Tax=Burkholderia plantarii TaxID=41899 RepID=UPI0011DF680F|nr:hypothetical protein [Burkholderia plantarii]